MYPPNIPAASPQYLHMPHISERDDLFFFGLHFILVEKLVIWESVDLFFDVTLFWAKNWASARVYQIIPPNLEKWQKKWSILLNHPPNAQHRFAPLVRSGDIHLPDLAPGQSRNVTVVTSRFPQCPIYSSSDG